MADLIADTTPLASLAAITGEKGDQGNPGADGKSAYQVAVDDGFVGTEAQWLLSLVGQQGPQGPSGPAGATGPQGSAGSNGSDGRGIASIVRTSGTGAAGTTDTYTITYSDATTSTFQVYNGADGNGTGDMLATTYDTNADGKVNSADSADAVPWSGVTGKPASFPPDAHTHAQYVDSADPRLSDARPASDVSAWAKAATKPSYTKTDVGLGNVNNTSDANKPISTATQTALDGKQVAGSYAAATHTHTVADVTGLQAALDGKQAAGSYATLAGAESLSNKTLSAPISTGAIYDNGSVRGNIVAVAALAIDCLAGNYFTKTINGASTFTFTNVPDSGNAYAFTLELTHTSGTVTWPTSVKWPGDTAPTLTTGRTHLFVFCTDDGGTRWRGVANTNYTN